MKIVFVDSIHALAAAQWNSLCESDHPFVRHEFLAALEDSQSTTAATGWQPLHLLGYVDDQLILALPGYIKTHSYGEYVFDWAWADAYRRHGYEYYPKWINAIPFSPCTGPRWLASTPITADTCTQVCAAIAVMASERGLSGWHCLFPEPELAGLMRAASMHQRLGCQFHWFNRGYINFDEFLATMQARKRKNIIKERRQVHEQGIYFQQLEGATLTPEAMTQFYHFYCATYLKRSGHNGYLTHAFFQQLLATMPEQLLLIFALIKDAQAEEQPIACAFFIRDTKSLYGRYWGSFDNYNFLHFETCYYQGIDYAIAQGLQRFDGGAQGEHKLLRGFEPHLSYSSHYLLQPQFHTAIGTFVQEEAAAIQTYQREAEQRLPFKQLK